MKIDLTIVVTICCAITSIAGAAAVIAKVVNTAIKKIAAETIKKELTESNQKLIEQMSDLKSQLTDFCNNQELVNEQVRESLLASTRDSINQAHDYYTERNYIGAHSLFVIEELYSSYKHLGGNSFVEQQMKDLRSLKIISTENF